MAVYARRVLTTDKRFSGRASAIIGTDQFQNVSYTRIPVPNDVVLCDGCNHNLHPSPGFGWLVYLSKADLRDDRPYDIFCGGCLIQYFPRCKEV